MTLSLPPAEQVLTALSAARQVLAQLEGRDAALQGAKKPIEDAEAKCRAALNALLAAAQGVSVRVGDASANLKASLATHAEALRTMPALTLVARADVVKARADGLAQRLGQLAGRAEGVRRAVDSAIGAAETRIEAMPEEAAEAIGEALETFLELPDTVAEEVGERIEEAIGTVEDLVGERIEASFSQAEDVLGELVANEIAEAMTTAVGSTTLSQALQPYLPQMIVVQQGLPILKKMLNGGL